MKTNRKRQRGAGLAEILIAVVVIGGGLFALMQLQATMSQSNALSKTRIEATEYAQKKTEELRAYIDKIQFNTSLRIDPSDTTLNPLTPLDELSWDSNPGDNADYTHTGVNSTFYEEIVVKRPGCNSSSTEAWCTDISIDNPNGSYIEVMIRESWIDESGQPQHVSLNNFIRFGDPGILPNLLAQNKEPISNSPLNRRSRWADEKVETGTESDTRDGSSGVEGDSTQGTAWSGDDVYRRENSKGNWEIYKILEDNEGNPAPVVVLTVYGGIIHEIRGTVYYEDTHLNAVGAEKLEILATSPSYCEFPLCDTAGCSTEYADKALSYACYVPGDCTNETTTENGNNDCPIGDSTSMAAIAERGLAGGWYGRIGIFGVPENPFDDIVTGDTCDAPSRNYVTHRISADSSSYTIPSSCTGTGYIFDSTNPNLIIGYCVNDIPYAIYENEGINTPYSIHQNFWLVDKNVKDQDCPLIVEDAWCDDPSDPNDTFGIGLALSNIIRTLIDPPSSSLNIIRPVNTGISSPPVPLSCPT